MLAVLRQIRATNYLATRRGYRTALKFNYDTLITNQMVGRVINAAEIAKQYEDEVKAQVNQLETPPLLVGYLANDDPSARKYAEWTQKTCRNTGIQFELREVHRMQLEEHIDIANEDKDVNGIIIYYPVFGGGQDGYLQNCVNPMKDVEGLCHLYRRNMYHNNRYLDHAQQQKSILPCTPLAIAKVLEYLGIYKPLLGVGNHMYGNTATIINRSEIVGRPLAALLANDGAKVYSVDVDGIFLFTRGEGIRLSKHKIVECDLTLDQCLSMSDIVIAGVPSKDYKVDTAKLKDGVVCINFATANNLEADVTERASLVVKQIGKVTVAMLQRNLLRLCQSQLAAKAMVNECELDKTSNAGLATTVSASGPS